MPVDDDDDDLFGQDFDFVDEDEDEGLDTDDDAGKSEAAEKSDAADKSDDEPEEQEPAKPKRRGRRGGKRGPKPQEEAAEAESGSDDVTGDEPAKKAEEEPPKPEGPPTDHVVHLYECREYKRTINREFTSEDAAAFVVEFNRTSAAHSREAVAANRDEKPAETH